MPVGTRRYYSSKTYTPSVGLSVAFRQWRADSHCRFLHGYAVSVILEFVTDELNDLSWVVDYGGLKSVKQWLQDHFDHKTLICEDDPELAWFREAHTRGIVDLIVVKATSSEAFADMIFSHVQTWLETEKLAPRVSLHRVTLREHEGNHATVEAI